MPIHTISKPGAPESDTPAAVGESLANCIDKDGKLTLAGQVVEAFLLSLDFSDIMDDEEFRECIDTAEMTVLVNETTGVAVEMDATDIKQADEGFELFKKKAKDEEGDDKKDADKSKKKDDEDGDEDGEDDDKKDDKADEAAKDEEGDEEDGDEEGDEEDEETDESRTFIGTATVETVAGKVMGELIDEDDLVFMFGHYVHSLPESTLVEKTTKAQAIQSLGLDEAELVEFQKGSFVKLHKSAQGKNKVSRMLLAMLAKQAIARAKPGQSRYVAAGSKKGAATYTKAGTSGRGDNYNTTGKVSYGHGTPAGVKKYYSYVGKNAGKSAAGEQKSGDKVKKSAAEIAKAAKAKASGTSMKAAPKADKKKAKLAAVAKKKPGVKKSLVAHDTSAVANLGEGERSSNMLHEGARMAGKIMGKVFNGRQMAVESTAKPKGKDGKQLDESETATKPAGKAPFTGRATIIRAQK